MQAFPPHGYHNSDVLKPWRYVRTPSTAVLLALGVFIGSVVSLSFSGAAFAQMPGAGGRALDYSSTGNLDEYSRYSEEGSRLFNAGKLTQSIEAYEKALAVAPDPSLPTIHNNLAVVLIRRGNDYHDRQKQDLNALNDFRRALFYLDTDWPEGVPRAALHEKNRQTTVENLKIAYQNLAIRADKSKHLEMARQLRMQGRFQEAVTEYAQALALDKKNEAAAKALGDLFTVLSNPEKAKKYYAIALQASGGAATGNISGGGTTGSGGNALSPNNSNQDEVLVRLGNAQYKTGETEKAVANFDKALAINPENVGALNMLEKIWADEIRFNPGSVLGHANLGGILQKKKRYDQALMEYNEAERLASQTPQTSLDTKKQIRLNLGTLFQARKDYRMALQAYDTVLSIDPNNMQAHFYKATALQESGNTEGAIQAYDKVLSIDPNNKAAQEKMLTLIRQQGDPARVAEGLRRYADRFANSAAVQAKVGEEFHQRQDLDSATLYYQRAVKINPALAETWANLGSVYQTQGKTEESIAAFRKAQSLEPNNPEFRKLAQETASQAGYQAYLKAVELQQQNKPTEALVQFRKALETMDTAEVHAAYGISLQSAGRTDDAIAEYRKAMAKADPKDAHRADYAYYLGTAHQRKNDLANARSAYQQAVALQPGHKEATEALKGLSQQAASEDLNKAIAAYERKDYPTALTLVNRALTQNNQDAMAHYYKGLVLDAQKKNALAARSYQEAIRYNPEFTDAYYALGVALDGAKDTRGAREAFEKFLALSGTNEDDFVKYARERLKTLPAATP